MIRRRTANRTVAENARRQAAAKQEALGLPSVDSEPIHLRFRQNNSSMPEDDDLFPPFNCFETAYQVAKFLHTSKDTGDTYDLQIWSGEIGDDTGTQLYGSNITQASDSPLLFEGSPLIVDLGDWLSIKVITSDCEWFEGMLVLLEI